jgi:DNA-binding transcriptional regulator YbjK
MVSNPQRRAHVTDAALAILGREGGRALSHRAVDAAAGVPTGTTANYFSTRAALMLAMAERVFERIAPDPGRLVELEAVPGSDALVEYTGYVVERLIANPDLARALIELRLAASRSPEVYDVLAPFLRRGLREDIEFHRARGLHEDAAVVLELHHLVNGILLDQLTIALEPESNAVATARAAARALVKGHAAKREGA